MNKRLKNNNMMYIVLVITIVISILLYRIVHNLTFNGMSVKYEMNSGPELLVMNETYDVGLIEKLKRKDLVGVTNNLYSSNGPILMGNKKYRIHFEIVGTKQYDSAVNFDLIKINNILSYRTYLLLILSFVILCLFNIVFVISLYFNVIDFR